MRLRRVLSALDFLHADAGVIYAGLKTDNIMLSADDDSMLKRFEVAESEDPSFCKVIDGSRAIYQSRLLPEPERGHYGLPVLCDFGEARIGTRQESGPFVQPHIYRSPEIMFEIPWGPPVDIWNLAALICDLFERRHFFQGIFTEKGDYDPFKHAAQTVAIIDLHRQNL